MNVHVPQHLKPKWIGREVSRRFHEGDEGRPVRKTKYIHPKQISIRQYIARAEQLKNT